MKPNIKQRGHSWIITYHGMSNVFHGGLRELKDWWNIVLIQPRNEKERKLAIYCVLSRYDR